MISRLYSETKLLIKDFNFNLGLNIIIGRYTGGKKPVGINGIGKSSLLRLIDYALVSDRVENLFSQEKYDFLREENHNIILEIIIEGEIFLIKRNFREKNTVYFGKKGESFDEFSKTEFKLLLTDKIFPIEGEDVFFEGNRFGTLISFFVKDDLEHQRRESPLIFLPYKPNTREIAIYNLFLLNLPTRLLIDLDTLVKDYDDDYKHMKKLEDRIYEETEQSIDEYKSEKIKIEENIEILERSLTEFRFEETYKNIEKRLIELTSKINSQLKYYNSLNRKSKKVKESYQLSEDVDTLEIQKLYNDTLNTFGDLVKNSLDTIVEFRKELITNRNKYLFQKEKELQ